ncbi:hypothetical protein TNCV_4963961 [Trichonephila clavipes]|nr:hypothetical protein TNCV_4963961 [Trichonephila clavipes]
MEPNYDQPMPTESRTPSRPSTPITTALCQRHTDLTDDNQKFILLIQGADSTLKSLQRFGRYNNEDPL